MDDVVTKELRRQAEYAQRSFKPFQQNLSQNQPEAVQKSRDTGAQNAMAAYSAVKNMPDPGTANANVAPAPSSGFLAPSQGQAARNTASDTSAANLQGYTNMGLQQQLGNLKANNAINLIGNQARASQAVLPIELREAQQVGQGEMDWSKIVSMLGSAALAAGGGTLLGGLMSPAAAAGSTTTQAADPFISWGAYGGGVSPSLSTVASPYMSSVPVGPVE
jgi:hypothetical protein